MTEVLRTNDIRIHHPTPNGLLRAVDGVSIHVGQARRWALSASRAAESPPSRAASSGSPTYRWHGGPRRRFGRRGTAAKACSRAAVQMVFQILADP